MVHALEQAHRVLTAQGTLADLHPDRGPQPGQRRIPVLVRGQREVLAGHLRGRPGGYEDYLAADRAVARVVRRGLFMLESSEVVPFTEHLGSLPVLQRLLEVDAQDLRAPGDALRARTGVTPSRQESRSRPGSAETIRW